MKECCRQFLADQFGGDEDVMNEIYGEYASSVGEKLAEARECLAKGDWPVLDRIAHTLKGNSLAAGDTEMADNAIELRKAAALGDVPECEARISAMAELSKLL